MKKALCALAFCLAACSPSGETVEGTVAGKVSERYAINNASFVPGGMLALHTSYLIGVDKGEDFILLYDDELEKGDRLKLTIGKCYNKCLLDTKERGKDWKTNFYWICDSKTLVLGRFKGI